MFTSQAIRNSTDGGTIDGDANKVNSGGPHSVQHQATGGGGGGATATAADAAAGPSAATTTTDKPSTSFLDDKTADKCNDTTPEPSTAGVAMVATSSSTGATVSSAKSSNDAAVGSSGTGPSPSTSSSEEWHSASSRLQRTPFSSDENSSSFYATPGTSSTSTTAEAGNRTGTSSGSSTSIELPSTSDDGKMTAPRKRLQWTPPPSAENKWARLGLPVNTSKDKPTNTTSTIGKGRSRSSSFDAEVGSIRQQQASAKRSKTGKCASSASSLRISRKNKKIPKKQVLLGKLQRSLDRALASPRDMYGSPDDLNVVEEKAGIIGMAPTTTESSKSARSSTTIEKVAAETKIADMADTTIGADKAGQPMKNVETDVGSTTRQVVLNDVNQKNPNADSSETIATPLTSTPMPPKMMTVPSVSGSGKNNSSIGSLAESTHQRDGGTTSKDDDAPSPANLLTLPDSHTKETTFPPSCPVLVLGHALAPAFTGTVVSVCIDVSPGSARSFLYCIKPNFPLPGISSNTTAVTVVESKIRFGFDCPVVATLNGRSANCTIEYNCEVDKGHGPTTMYTIHLPNPGDVGPPDSHLRHGVAPKELKFRPSTEKGDAGVMGTLADPSNRATPSSKTKDGSHFAENSFEGNNGDKSMQGPPEGKHELEDDLENHNTKDNEQPQNRFCKSATKETEERSTRSQTSNGSFSFDIKSTSNDVAIAVGIVSGLDLARVRDLLYGPNKSTNERMEKSLDVKVAIVGRDFDAADPSVQLADDWNLERPYVIVRGIPKCVRKAAKVVSHLLCEATYDGEDKDRLKKAIVEATAECAIIYGDPLEAQGDCNGRRQTDASTTTSGEASFYASMNQENDTTTPARKYPSVSNNSGQNYTYRINFPSWMHSGLVVGRIVGKKGQNVNKLCEKFNCSIDTFGASTTRPREYPSDSCELPNLVCVISGTDKEQIEKCRLDIEFIAIHSAEHEWRGRFEYDLAVANELGYEDHFCYYENPRNGGMVVYTSTYSNDSGGSYCYMTCIDVSQGVVEAPKEILGDLEELGKRFYCQLYLEGSIDEPYLHIVGDTREGVEWAAHEIYQRLTKAATNSSTAATEEEESLNYY